MTTPGTLSHTHHLHQASTHRVPENADKAHFSSAGLKHSSGALIPAFQNQDHTKLLERHAGSHGAGIN